VSEQSTAKIIHATAMEIFDTGVLIIGKPKIGKSELALELLTHGHKIIGDDAIEISSTINRQLLAKPAAPINQKIHLRSIGMIDVKSHFNEQQIIGATKIDLVINIKDTQAHQPTAIKPQIKTINKLGITIPEWTLFTPSCCSMATKVETLIKQYRIEVRSADIKNVN
jgi:HPr kinase/phosphorylase